MTESAFALPPGAARLLGGRKAPVTGADSGIGRGIAFELAAHGGPVADNYLCADYVDGGMTLYPRFV
jgi:glucose 1-dehydrogenase